MFPGDPARPETLKGKLEDQLHDLDPLPDGVVLPIVADGKP